MNKAKDFTVTLGRTVNLGNFENVKPELSATFPGEVTYQEAFEEVKKALADEVARLETNVHNSQNVPPPTPKAQNDSVNCGTHGVPMLEGKSKKTGKYYKYHRSTDGQMCFGQGFQ